MCNYQIFFLLITYFVFSVNSIPLNGVNEEKQPYIVILKLNVSTNFQDNDDLYQSHLSWIKSSSISSLSNTRSITNFFGSNQHEIIRKFAIGDHFRGYVGLFEPKFVDEVLSKRDDVELITPDSEVQVAYDSRNDNTDSDDFSCSLEEKVRKFSTRIQENPTWNLDRIDQRKLPLDNNYVSPATRGRGVNIYVIDTGININHTDFNGRASWGITIQRNAPDVDEYGHGTHVAGIIAGSVHGVSKIARVIAVKALGKKGTGTWSDVIAGMNWVAQQHKADLRKRTIVNLSLTGKYFPPANAAVKALVDLGIHVTVAAGNYFRANSCYFSPASTPEAVTTGATSIDDFIPKFSNIGPCVDLFAPGHNITSTWFGANGTKKMSGTSMASPHVAGVIALIISQRGNMSPAKMKELLKLMATYGALKNADSLAAPNIMLYVDKSIGYSDCF